MPLILLFPRRLVYASLSNHKHILDQVVTSCYRPFGVTSSPQCSYRALISQQMGPWDSPRQTPGENTDISMTFLMNNGDTAHQNANTLLSKWGAKTYGSHKYSMAYCPIPKATHSQVVMWEQNNNLIIVIILLYCGILDLFFFLANIRYFPPCI